MSDSTPTEADIHLIQRVIPHRYPFLFVDRVEQIVPFESAVGIKNVTFNEPHFQGHFPAAPIMPGVAIVEAMAQTAVVMAGLSMGVVDRDVLIYFMSIDKCKFRRMVVPGDVLKLHMQVIQRRTRVWKMKGVARVGDEVACEAEIAAMLDLRE